MAWTTGFKVPELARRVGLAVDDRGRLLVDGTMRSRSHPEVYGIGDAAATLNHDGLVLRMGCGPGGLAAACAVRAITRRMTGRTPKPLRMKHDALCISLGRRDAILQPTTIDGTPRGKVRTGWPALMLKSAVLRTTGWAYPRHPGLVLISTAGRT